MRLQKAKRKKKQKKCVPTTKDEINQKGSTILKILIGNKLKKFGWPAPVSTNHISPCIR